MERTLFTKASERPQWVRARFTQEIGLPGVSPMLEADDEFTNQQKDKHIVEYKRTGSRGKERVMVLFEQQDYEKPHKPTPWKGGAA